MAALVYELTLPFAVNSSKHYIKFVAELIHVVRLALRFLSLKSLFHSL